MKAGINPLRQVASSMSPCLSLSLSPSFLSHLSIPFCPIYLSLSLSLSLHPFLVSSLSCFSLSLVLYLLQTLSLSLSLTLFVGIEPATTDVKSHVHTTTPPHPLDISFSEHYIITLILNIISHDIMFSKRTGNDVNDSVFRSNSDFSDLYTSIKSY